MIKVYEDFNFSRVGQMQSLLESHGINTFLKNEFGSSVVGELPFVEVIPQLYVLDKTDAPRAQELITLNLSDDPPAEDWVCNACGIEVEGSFFRCWQCGVARKNS